MTCETRIEKLEAKVDVQATALARMDERQKQMHADLAENTAAVAQLTKQLTTLNNFIENTRGAKWMLGFIVTALATVGGFIGYFISK